jgi:Tol biopolymer transport system component
MKTKMLIVIFLLGVMTLTAVAQTNSTNYFGQTPPGDTAVVFAPGIISLTDRKETRITFSPDGKECFFATNNGLYSAKNINNEWTEPIIATFKTNLNLDKPYYSADGKRLYFTCFNADYTTTDIWFAERTETGWGDPQLLPAPINSSSYDFDYSESNDSVAYFSSDRPNGFGSNDIWCARHMHNQKIQVENLGSTVNASSSDFSPCISPDGSYLIFASTRTSKYSSQTLWISFIKGGNGWTKPIDMNSAGAKINFARYWHKDPSISPDGKYLFFNLHTSSELQDTIDIYWVSTHVIVGLKKFAFAPKLTNQVPDINIKPDSILNYVIPNATFSCEYGSETLKYTAALSNGAALPSWLFFNPATKTLSGKPNGDESSTIKITATNADTVSDSCLFKIMLKDNN